MTNDVVAKLEQAFSEGCKDIEACIYAEIVMLALYDTCRECTEFIDRKEAVFLKITKIYKTISLLKLGVYLV
jgi:hypothetical protein